jgi:hypothetical protein
LETQSQRVRRKEEDSLMKQRQLMGAITKTMASSGVAGAGFNLMQGLGGMRLQDAQRLKQLKNTKNLTPDEKLEKSSLQSRSGKIGGIFSKLDAIFEKNFGDGSKWNDMMGGHGKEGAVMVTLAGIGGGLALGKMIIDSSPAFQQLLKIMNFGIMLILRPIGDFFAFLFRPILILLLRKFIIPFYQTVYPWFMKHGKLYGDVIAGLADTGDGIVKAVQESAKFLASDLTAVIKPATNVVDDAKVNPLAKIVQKIIPKVTPALAVLAQSPTGTQMVAKPADNILQKIAKPLQKALLPIIKLTETPAVLVGKAVKGLANITGHMSKTGLNVTKALANAGTGNAIDSLGKQTSKVTKPLTNAVSSAIKPATTAIKAAAKTSSRFIPIVGQALLAVDAAGSLMKQFAPEQYEGVRQGALGIGGMLGDDKGVYTEGVLDFLGFGKKSTAEQIVGGAGWLSDMATGNKRSEGEGAFGLGGDWFGMANGGIIKEPIKGIGKSGQKYKFGEQGAEAVIPMNGMGGSGTTINVTVNGSIYSDKDMLNFQRTIMRAIETSTTRRAKL